MSRNLNFLFYLVYLFNSYQQKNIYQNRAAQGNLLLNRTNLKNLEDESDAFKYLLVNNRKWAEILISWEGVLFWYTRTFFFAKIYAKFSTR